MLKLIKEAILNNKQAAIRRKFPGLNIVLHSEMPSPSMNKMVELAVLVSMVNSYEKRMQEFTDAQLRAKTDEFKRHLREKSEQFSEELEELRQGMLSVAMPEEK